MCNLEGGAMTSVGRACGFAVLAIFLLMAGLAGFPVIALKTGAAALMLVAAVLAAKAAWSPNKPYKRTELWMLLEPHERPQPEIAQTVIGNVLREAFARFALYFAFAALIVFVLATFAQLVLG